MASKSVDQSYDTDALLHFGLTGTYYGIVSGSGVRTVLVEDDEKTKGIIHELLTKPTLDNMTFRTKKKAFVLPKSEVSADRIKAALKEHGIVVTNDYTKADLIVAHDDIYSSVENGQNIPAHTMLNKLWNYETTMGDPASVGVMKTISNSGLECIITNRVTDQIRYYNIDIQDSITEGYIFTGLAVNLAHKIALGEVDVIDTQSVLHASANVQVLDEQLLEDLIAQLNSGGDSRELAGSIIPTIDYTKNFHFLWKLSQECYNIDSWFSRNKDVQYWYDKSNFYDISRRNAQDMIQWLEEEGKLCKQSFRYLEPICRKEIHISNRDLYVFKVQVKKEYLKYMK